MNDITTKWDDTICWFCRKRAADNDAKYTVDLYRVISRKSTFVVFGTQYKQEYEKTNTWVPRCSSCSKKHARVFWFYFLLWFTFSTWASYKLFVETNIQRYGASPFESMIDNVVGVFMLFFISLIPFTFLLYITNQLWNSEDKAYYHFRVTQLTNDGWEIGTSPAYKWLGDDIDKKQ